MPVRQMVIFEQRRGRSIPLLRPATAAASPDRLAPHTGNLLRSLPQFRNQSSAAYAASSPLVDSQLAMRIEQGSHIIERSEQSGCKRRVRTARECSGRLLPPSPPAEKITARRRSGSHPPLQKVASLNCGLMMSKGNSRANGISERESTNQPDCENDQNVHHSWSDERSRLSRTKRNSVCSSSPPPAEKITARRSQAGKASTGNGTGDART